MSNSEYKYNIPVTEEELDILTEALNLYSTRLNRIAYEETDCISIKQKLYNKAGISDNILIRVLRNQINREG